MLNNYIKQVQLFLEASYKQNRFYLKVQLNQSIFCDKNESAALQQLSWCKLTIEPFKSIHCLTEGNILNILNCPS